MDPNDISNELQKLKKQMQALESEKEAATKALESSYSTEKMNEGLITLLKFMIEENKKTTMLLKKMSDNIDEIESAMINVIQDEKEDKEEKSAPLQEEEITTKEIPISEQDKKILQFIQIKGMACADDIKNLMGYKGRNAACARLNSLYKNNLLSRYQLGHKVYYKFNAAIAGKTTNILIISPP
ncbi:MAG: hypothetical protein ACP5RP_00865 [Candidatus Micrarchaeia archaeon]